MSEYSKQIHVVEIITNRASVPYFNWFADRTKDVNDLRFTFVCLNDEMPPMKEDMEARNCTFFWIPFNQAKRKRNYILAIVRLYKLFKKIKPDIVHTHLFDDGLPAMIAAWLAGVKTRIHTKQSTGFHWYYAKKMIPFDRLVNRLATHLIAVSEEAKDFIANSEKAKPHKVNMIHHGIDLNNLIEFDDLDQKELIEKYNLTNKKVVLMLARYIDWKGYKDAIQAANLLKDEIPDLVFLGVGAGDHEAELKELISKSGLEGRFILTGWIQKKYVPALFNLSKVFLHAACREPFGFVFPEAMINRVPIVSTATGAARDALIHLESAFLVEYHQPEKLAEGIRYVLNNDTTAMINKAAHQAREMFHINKMFEQHVALYRSSYARH